MIRFDGTRGYGFIAPEDGGEDVFLHVNDMLIPESYVRSGTALEFEVEDGDRGLKASSVRLATNPDGTPVTPPAAASASGGASTGTSTGRAAAGDDALCDALSRSQYLREVTEVLLESVPTLTGAQIVQVRNRFLQVAQGHGWIEG
ncbi:cold-shock protein [Streptomyces sp. NPDC098789]|uniref:cold-shock protein n=1 Tax=Streptomyces sp. NPDC098789 TaxID=3366098 RepID=UPI0037F617C2